VGAPTAFVEAEEHLPQLRVDAAAGLDPDANSSRELGTGLITGPKEATGKSLSLRKKSWRRGWDSKERTLEIKSLLEKRCVTVPSKPLASPFVPVDSASSRVRRYFPRNPDLPLMVRPYYASSRYFHSRL
jgi:hypothetical protein